MSLTLPAVLLLLALPLRAGELPKPEDPPGAKAVGASGWKVSEPKGFALLPPDEHALYVLAWVKEWKEKARDKKKVYYRRHAEHVRVFFDETFAWAPGSPLPATCQPPHKPRKRPIEGRHYGRPTLSYACDDGTDTRSDTQVYYLVLDRTLPEAADAKFPPLWARIALSYHHEWDRPPLPPKADKTPSLAEFRWMGSTLSPIESAPPGAPVEAAP